MRYGLTIQNKKVSGRTVAPSQFVCAPTVAFCVGRFCVFKTFFNTTQSVIGAFAIRPQEVGMKKFSVLVSAVLSVALLSLGSVANARGDGPKMSADDFFAKEKAREQEVQKRGSFRPFSSSAGRTLPPLFTYQYNGQAYWYMSSNAQCVNGGYPTESELQSILINPSVSLLNEDGQLTVLHCLDEDIIVRVKKEPYQELLLAYTTPDEPTTERGGKVFSTTLSSWPARNSLGYEGTVFDAAYVVVTNETDGIQLTHNGAEAFVQMSPGKLFELTGWTEKDLKCQTEVVSLMIPLKRAGYFPGETGDAYVSTFLRGILEGMAVPDIKNQMEVVSCHGELYDVLAPRFPSGTAGSS